MSKETEKRIGFTRERRVIQPPTSVEPLHDVKLMGATYEEWQEIYIDVDILTMHGYRQGAARRLGLPEDTSWEDIYRFTDEQDRLHLARRYELPDTATWDEIQPYHDQDESIIPKGDKGYNLDQEDLRKAAAGILDLPERSSDWLHIFERAVLVGVSSSEDVINRLREIELHYLEQIARGERHRSFDQDQ